MDKTILSDLTTTAKALRAAIVRSQNGLAGLQHITKLGAGALPASAPILAELRQLEADMQKFLKAYKDQSS
jgi:hypothetical protein